MSDDDLRFDGETVYYEAGALRWYPQADGSPMHTSPPPVGDGHTGDHQG